MQYNSICTAHMECIRSFAKMSESTCCPSAVPVSMYCSHALLRVLPRHDPAPLIPSLLSQQPSDLHVPFPLPCSQTVWPGSQLHHRCRPMTGHLTAAYRSNAPFPLPPLPSQLTVWPGSQLHHRCHRRCQPCGLHETSATVPKRVARVGRARGGAVQHDDADKQQRV